MTKDEIKQSLQSEIKEYLEKAQKEKASIEEVKKNIKDIYVKHYQLLAKKFIYEMKLNRLYGNRSYLN